jgi:predicted ATPase
MVFLRGSDAGISALAYDALCLWCLGYPDQAYEKSQEALSFANQLDHPFSLADVLCYAGCMFNAMRPDPQALKEAAEALILLSWEKGFPGWKSTATWFRGGAMTMLGQVTEGITQIHEGMAVHRSLGQRCYFTEALCFLAEAQAKSGQPEGGLTTLAEALDLVEETGEHHWEAELHRLQWELLLMQGDEQQAEVSFQKAIQVAQKQSAKSWELRASIGLTRLWVKQNKLDEARQLLAEIYNWFMEGFDTPDLKEAQALLEELSK